jgi:uncharacterized protein YpmS
MKLEIKGSAWDIVTMTLAALSLLLVIVNAVLVVRNQSLQVEMNDRQQVINQGLQLARLRQVLAQTLGNLAITKQDHDLSDLLSRHGISVTGQAPAAAAPQGK